MKLVVHPCITICLGVYVCSYQKSHFQIYSLIYEYIQLCTIYLSLITLCYVQEMRRLGCKWSTDVRQIDLDVNRTYRDHMMFRKRYDVKQQQLFHVLGQCYMQRVKVTAFRPHLSLIIFP